MWSRLLFLQNIFGLDPQPGSICSLFGFSYHDTLDCVTAAIFAIMMRTIKKVSRVYMRYGGQMCFRAAAFRATKHVEATANFDAA